MTVGILFIIDDRKAAIKPIDMVAMNNPCSAAVWMTLANESVSQAFPKPYTTTYIPIEKNTIFHGAPLITAFVLTTLLLLAINKKKMATTPATKETGTPMNSLVK